MEVSNKEEEKRIQMEDEETKGALTWMQGFTGFTSYAGGFLLMNA